MPDHESFPIIDSHIHLYAESHLPRLGWSGELPEGHVLKRGNTVEVYKRAVAGTENLRGFVFLETDRKSGLADDQWEDALEEAAFLSRIAQGTSRPDEGHVPADSSLVMGVVPWAPVPAGASALAKYVSQILDLYPEPYRGKVKGFRYLLQDKPKGVMLQPKFIEALQWLGQKDFSFDLGVDARSAGLHQLKEACTMFQRLEESGTNVTVVINHFCKPNLHLTATDALQRHPDFVQWKEYIHQLSTHKTTYMKLSGFFSELPPQSEESPAGIGALLNRIKPWVSEVFEAFGPSRIMFGSDWPVCNVGGPGPTRSWQHWHNLVSALLTDLGLTSEQKARVWSGTAAEAYKISSDH
jgi:L-rhamnono-1,4-lactonase